MKLKKLAEKAAKLPDLEFDWGGAENATEEVLDQGVIYLKALKDRISAQSYMLHDLVEAYRKIKDVILEADVEPEAKVRSPEGRCPECNEPEPALYCDNCGHTWPCGV